MDISGYTREDFNALSIHLLRLLARDIGVAAPTTKNKKQLVDLLMAKKDLPVKTGAELVKEASIKLQERRAKSGRPPKSGQLLFCDPIGEEHGPFIVQRENSDDDDEGLYILVGMTTDVESAFVDEEVETIESVSESEEPDEPVREEEEKAKSGAKTYKKIQRKPSLAVGKKSKAQNNDTVVREKPVLHDDSDSVLAREEDSAESALEIREGILEIMQDGYGFLRARNYESGSNDAYVSLQKIKKYSLRKGDKVKAEARQVCENKPAGLVNVISINDIPIEQITKRINFDSLTPIYPDERFRLEIQGQSNDFAIRSIDLIAPIGKGQRAMIVSPPKAGKTTLLKKIAHSISANYPDAHLIVLLIDERPEEVTDMQRSIQGEVVYSTFDEMPEHHTKAAELVLERAKRLVEDGRDVIILMDSLTRLARAYNLSISPTGRTLSGGIDPGALHSPKRFFGAARNIENGGSLTIIATALIDTGSRMDDVIYEEFKGTGNMEIHLDRRLSEKRIFPAIDLNRSGTRREELLLDQTELQGTWAMRKILSSGGESADATENLLNMMVKTKTNKEFIQQVNLQVVSMQKQGFFV